MKGWRTIWEEDGGEWRFKHTFTYAKLMKKEEEIVDVQKWIAKREKEDNKDKNKITNLKNSIFTNTRTYL